MNKKGIVQLQESILVMFFIMIIIAMGLIIFYRFSLSSVHNYEDEYRDQQLLSLLITLPNDFGYSYLGDSKNAIDTTKLFNQDLDYGFKKIKIQQVYPVISDEIKCTPNSYPNNCNTFVVYDRTSDRFKNKLIESIPISLYYPLDNKYRAGKLIVEYYY